MANTMKGKSLSEVSTTYVKACEHAQSRINGWYIESYNHSVWKRPCRSSSPTMT